MSTLPLCLLTPPPLFPPRLLLPCSLSYCGFAASPISQLSSASILSSAFVDLLNGEDNEPQACWSYISVLSPVYLPTMISRFYSLFPSPVSGHIHLFSLPLYLSTIPLFSVFLPPDLKVLLFILGLSWSRSLRLLPSVSCTNHEFPVRAKGLRLRPRGYGLMATGAWGRLFVAG